MAPARQLQDFFAGSIVGDEEVADMPSITKPII
jgi:hypothetical protein